MTFDLAGVACNGASIDTRVLRPGAVFLAMRGERADGHDFVSKAFEGGAAAAVVERRADGCGPQLVVPDVLAWLQQQAKTLRRRWSGKVVAVTGSAGKTITKEALARVLSTRIPTGKTAGNYNNHIGVPLSILNIDDADRVAVLEIGMNHAGEIRDLAAIAAPDVAVVTNAGTAHIENLGSRDAVAAAKRELVEALPPDGIAVLNVDDARVRAFAAVHPGRTIYYGFSEAAHVRALEAEYLATGTRFEVAGVGSFFCPVPGLAGVMAALAALAAGQAFGIDLPALAPAVAAMEAPGMRLRRVSSGGMTIWDDCYNANPEAVEMTLDLLGATPARRRVAVLGEMRELGAWSAELHRDIGRSAARRGLDLLVGVRGDARCMVDAALQAGMAPGTAVFFDEPAEAGQYLKRAAREGDALLFKGSRGTHMETALEEFLR
jgi:UDP-N-acetylmuramoyl-tripeptide--D-alanyl-D-alanine ligase